MTKLFKMRKNVTPDQITNQISDATDAPTQTKSLIPASARNKSVSRKIRKSRQTLPKRSRHKQAAYGGVMRQKVRTDAEEALQDLVNHGLVRHSGKRNGQIVYKLVPDAELSDGARAYLRSLREDELTN